ncbi:elongation of very long chain fatty acids protein 4-like isoform X2 [Pomacea canaliculata]|uniref:elongation of very long chain fatty acids protein 4-like isoform X2 n=1 Tax=Pomacea canaliculata TaxID=400727 RepID=UPI000D72A0B8|nr:elongation of very long chain fatty acids protein 4-like isoform X2 [Pomacea canaliculata]
MEVIRDKISEFHEFYEWAHSVSDDRVKDWLFMQGYTPTLVLSGLYLVAVYIGPKLMKDREPFKFKYTLFIYNFILIIMNFHICSELFINSIALGYSYSCQPVSYTYDPREMRVAKALWWFYFSKLVEMLDTIFFILRKKDNQVSFLHVYHHATMFPIWYIGVKWVAGGQSFFGAMINSFIHVIMYTYYGVSALGPEYQKYLWWKRYLTKLQLLQFFVGMVYAIQGIILECEFPMWMQWAGIVYGITIIALFINFYIQAYIKADNKKLTSNGKQANGYVSNGDTKLPKQWKAEAKKDK